jgi:hypothetical protein
VAKNSVKLRGKILYSKVWFNTPQLAAVEKKQCLKVFGIKTDVLNKFPLEEPPFQIGQR